MSNNSGLTIITPGPLSLMQDIGRKHVQQLGCAEGGACDSHAFFWANYLLENSGECAVIEITFGPFEAFFETDTVIAIAGADLNCKINEKPINNWSSHKVSAGDIIRFTPGNNGIRAYLAVKGGFNTQKQFGSFSEVAREQFSSPIVKKDALLSYAYYPPENWRITYVPPEFIPDYKADLVLRVIPSYQYNGFDNASKDVFTQSQYSISPNSDRMGYRFQGEEVEWGGEEIISEGIAFGSIQIPPDGQPIILLNDRQTIGGYPKIGCVCKKDCNQLVQRQAKQKISFKFVSAQALQSVKFCNLHPSKY